MKNWTGQPLGSFPGSFLYKHSLLVGGLLFKNLLIFYSQMMFFKLAQSLVSPNVLQQVKTIAKVLRLVQNISNQYRKNLPYSFFLIK